jgi:hypothetical protein
VEVFDPASTNILLRESFADCRENTFFKGWVYPFTKTPPLTRNVLKLLAYVCVVVRKFLIVPQTMLQETWLPSRSLAMDGRSDLDIPGFSGRPHCSLLKAVRPEYPNGVSPFLFFRGLCLQRLFFWARCFLLLLVFFSRVAVIILQPLPPLPPYVRSSWAAPWSVSVNSLNVVVFVFSVSLGAGASTWPAPALTFSFFF